MARLFDRRWYLSIGTLDVSDLDLGFTVERSTRREPNTAEIRIWNLSRDSRALVEDTPNARVVLRAGYAEDGDPPPVLFVGDKRRAWTERDGPDFVTIVQSRDGGRAYNQARISRSYAPGTPVRSVLVDVVEAMGIGRGNLDEFSSAYALRNGADSFPDGFVASGPVRNVLDDLVRGAGLRWSVQNGALQLQRRGTPLQTRAVLLSHETGLVESPTRDEHGTVTALCLIQPGLDPGRRVVLESDVISGGFEIRKVSYTGETRGNDWHATLELKALS